MEYRNLNDWEACYVYDVMYTQGRSLLATVASMWQGGGGQELFSYLESCALLGGSGACPPPENILKMV